MSYVALYRKFRPADFSQVKGQDHIVKTLKNQIVNNRIGHAYLFIGTRGTGKTSVAKLFAKAVNCENPVNGEPCNECSICKAISKSSSMNVIEIDAASNNSVDNIRQINEEVQYSPPEGKYKVYIIDEVHMLSAGAFNALLKTLEEPPSYVIFILATTEVHKIPITILSRCQRYDFRRISIDTITRRMQELVEIEGVKADEKALKYIAKLADGSMRDALSLLDQCVAFNFGEEINYEKALEVLGAVDTKVFSEMLYNVIKGDTLACIYKLKDIIYMGKELGQFVNDFTWYLRNLLLVMTAPDNNEEILEMSPENIETLKEEAKMTDSDTVMRYIRIFSELSGQIRNSAQKQVMVEIALIKLTRPQTETDYESILGRLTAIENKLESGVLTTAAPTGSAVNNNIPEDSAVIEKAARPLEIAVPDEVQWVADNAEKVFSVFANEGLLKAFLKECRLSSDGGNKLLMVTDSNAGYQMLGEEEIIKKIENSIENQLGKRVEVKMELLKPDEKYNDNFVEITKRIKMEIIEEEE